MSVASKFCSEAVKPAARVLQADQSTEVRSDPGTPGAGTRGVGVGPMLTAAVRLALPTPGANGLLVPPQGETPAGDQRSVVLGPVPDPAWSLVMTAPRIRATEAGKAGENLRRLHS